MDNYLLAGSEELSRKFNDLASFYSDFHKDVYGTRPRYMAMVAEAYDSEDAAQMRAAACRLRARA